MLILTRRPVETIEFTVTPENLKAWILAHPNEDFRIDVTLLGIVGNQARFGLTADKLVTIDRREIAERKRRAAGGDVDGNR